MNCVLPLILNRLKTLRKSITSIQREGQARSPTKSEWDSANAKPYKHTDDCSTKSEWDSAENLIDGGDGEQSPPSRLGIVSEL